MHAGARLARELLLPVDAAGLEKGELPCCLKGPTAKRTDAMLLMLLMLLLLLLLLLLPHQ